MLGSLKKGLPFSVPAPAISIAAGLLILFTILYWQSISDLVTYWGNEKTYSHGFIIALISVYLLSKQSKKLARTPLKPSILLLIPLFFTLIIWLFASITNIQIILLTLLPIIFLLTYGSIIGYKATLIVSTSILYILLAIPFWDLLTQTLQNMAVYVNEHALSFTGISTYINGTKVIIPAGTFEIVGGCSGIRYLIVTLALGSLFSILNYNKLKPTLIILFLSILFPIITNWIRIYLIILAGHFSDMQSSLVNDHDNFGWALYAISLIPLYLIAKKLIPHDPIDEPILNDLPSKANNKPYPKIFILFPLLLVIGVTYISSLIKSKELSTLTEITPPLAQFPWSGPIYFNQWHPSYKGASIESNLLYIGSDNNPDISLHIYYYGKQSKDIELISVLNSIADSNLVKTQKNIKFERLDITETIIRKDENNKRLIWHWFFINNTNIINRLWAKLLQAQELINGKISSSLIALSVECHTECNEEKIALGTFLNFHHEKILDSFAQ